MRSREHYSRRRVELCTTVHEYTTHLYEATRSGSDMSDEFMLNTCGHSCSFCPSYQGEVVLTCQGCRETHGTPWWGVCKVFECSIKHDIMHCGLWRKFPCELLTVHYNPENPIGQHNAVIRIGILAYRARHGDEKAVVLAKKVRSIKG